MKEINFKTIADKHISALYRELEQGGYKPGGLEVTYYVRKNSGTIPYNSICVSLAVEHEYGGDVYD